MILGRSTVQWTSLITAAGGLAQVLIVLLVTGIDPVLVATIIGSVIAFLGVFVAFLANTQTTPIHDPVLPGGTTGKVQDSEETFTVPPGPTSNGAGG
jgi:hypothetical protein